MQPLLKVNRMNLKPWRGRFLSGGLLLLSALMLSTCASKPQNYYTLTAPTEKTVVSANSPPIFIELLAVAVPERLARPQLVLSQVGDHSAEIIMLEQHRWISSFEKELHDGLASGISHSIGAIDVSSIGRPAAKPVWRIAVQLRQFDAIENMRVDAAFSWTIRRSDHASSVSCQWSGSEPVGPGINSLAQGAQRLTQQAALAMAQHLTMLAADHVMATCAP